jgi:O-succinylbenzoate synthase
MIDKLFEVIDELSVEFNLDIDLRDNNLVSAAGIYICVQEQHRHRSDRNVGMNKFSRKMGNSSRSHAYQPTQNLSSHLQEEHVFKRCIAFSLKSSVSLHLRRQTQKIPMGRKHYQPAIEA